MKYVFWGLGSVGRSFLDKLKENGYFNPDSFYLIDSSLEAKDYFIQEGGKPENVTIGLIDKDTVQKYLDIMEEGDYILEFCCDIKNTLVLKYCLTHKIHYIFTADASWRNDLEWTSCHQHFLEYLDIKKEYKDYKTTSIIEFGMNPGMVSMFVKQGIREIVEHDDSRFVRKNREKLREFLDKNEFGRVAKLLKIEDVQEVDNDDQETNIPYENGTCYSTWNVWSYYYETVSSPELALSTKSRFRGYGKIYDCDFKDLFLAPYKAGFEYKDASWSAQGRMIGHISTHEEIFSIRQLLTFGKYKPTVHFLYSPCKYANESIKQFKDKEPTSFRLIKKEEITSGGESVGVIIQGKRFKTRYFGNYLDTTKEKECATILQVSASAFAAFQYMIKHPNEGMLFPEDLDDKEVVEIAKQYLKEYTTFTVPKVKMNLCKYKFQDD